MNEQIRQPFPDSHRPGSTQVADGLPRRAWTADEMMRMLDAGIIEHNEPFELVGGELVAKMQKGIAHEALKIALNEFWGKVRPDHIRIAPESALRLGKYDEPEPEFFVFPADIAPADVRGPTVLLVVEVADSSLGKDRTLKALRYATNGVREYWVINVRTHETTVFQEPAETGFIRRFEVTASEFLTPLHAPELAVRLSDIK